MTTYLRSAKGQVNTKEAWEHWLHEEFWPDINAAHWGMQKHKPADAWERAVKILGLREIAESDVDTSNLDRLRCYNRPWTTYNNLGA